MDGSEMLVSTREHWLLQKEFKSSDFSLKSVTNLFK